MMFSRLCYFVIIVYFLVVYPFGNVEAFDGKRKGFCFGMGIGPGMSVYNTAYYTTDSYLYSKPVFSLNYKIGYAPSEEILIYFGTCTSLYFPLDRHYNFSKYDLYTYGTSGLGFMLFPSQDSNFYLSGYFGLTAANDVKVGQYDNIVGILSAFGVGVLYSDLVAHIGTHRSVGIGYEISPNLVVDFTFNFTSYTDYNSYYYDSIYDDYYIGDTVTFSVAFYVFFY